jgi:hypothetical protein
VVEKIKIGDRHGRMTVTGHRTITIKAVLLTCDCGRTKVVRLSNLPRTHSCGCLNSEVSGRRNRSHGQSNTRMYWAWGAMIERCHKPTYSTYPRYGGRGITVCDRWRESFENFLADMGPRPKGMTLERVDNNKGYGPDNCIWATYKQQASNTRRNVFVIVDGERFPLAEAARRVGTNNANIYSWAARHGKELQDAVDWYAANPLSDTKTRPRQKSKGYRFITYDGETLPIFKAAEKIGVDPHAINSRVYMHKITHQEAFDWFVAKGSA